MALLGQIPATSTGVINLDYVPEQLLVVDATTGAFAFANVTALSLVQSGRQLATITGTRTGGMAKLGALINGSSQALTQLLELAKGRVNGSATLTITSNSANILNVYGFSSGFSRDMANYIETSINANANQSFSGFDALLLSTPANIDRVNITFADGFNDDFKPEELQAILGQLQNSENLGLLSGALVVANFGGQIANAVVYVNGSGSCVVGVKRTINVG